MKRCLPLPSDFQTQQDHVHTLQAWPALLGLDGGEESSSREAKSSDVSRGRFAAGLRVCPATGLGFACALEDALSTGSVPEL